MLAAKWEVWCAALGVDVRWEAANESTFPNQHQRSNQNSHRMKNKFGVIDRSLNWTVGGRGWTNFPSRSDSLFTPQISSFHYIFWRNVTNHLPICWPWLLTCCCALLAGKKKTGGEHLQRPCQGDRLFKTMEKLCGSQWARSTAVNFKRLDPPFINIYSTP